MEKYDIYTNLVFRIGPINDRILPFADFLNNPENLRKSKIIPSNEEWGAFDLANPLGFPFQSVMFANNVIITMAPDILEIRQDMGIPSLENIELKYLTEVSNRFLHFVEKYNILHIGINYNFIVRHDAANHLLNKKLSFPLEGLEKTGYTLLYKENSFHKEADTITISVNSGEAYFAKKPEQPLAGIIINSNFDRNLNSEYLTSASDFLSQINDIYEVLAKKSYAVASEVMKI